MDIATAKQVLVATHKAALLSTGADVRAAAYCMESGPGLGKSDAVRQVCAQLARDLNHPVGLVVFMLATIASSDVRGFMIPVKSATSIKPKSVFSEPPWLPETSNLIVFEPNGTVWKEGTWTGEVPEIGVLFLDEFGQAEEDVKKPSAELLYKGNVGSSHLPRGWRVLAATNRTSDRSGVMRELMFVVNRRGLMKIDPVLAPWLAWANAQPPELRPHYLTITFAQKNPDVVFKDTVPEGTDPFCTPRTLCIMDRELMALRSPADIAKNRLPTDVVAREVAAMWIGGASSAQFFTHVKYHDELPDIADIVKDPAKAKLPTGKDAQMVCAYMLAHGAEKKNAVPIINYMQRLNIEMQVLMVRAVLSQQARAADVVNTKEMTAWLAKNKDVLIASRS